MGPFKRSRKFAPLVLGAWLIATGAPTFVPVGIPYREPILAALAIAAGVLVLLDR